MERRSQRDERRKQQQKAPDNERRTKSRRRARNFLGSPPSDRMMIDVSDDDQLQYWSTELGVKADVLKAAVQAAGPSVKSVREHLRK